MTYEISHQRLNFRFLKDYLLWRACEKPDPQTCWIIKKENHRYYCKEVEISSQLKDHLLN